MIIQDGFINYNERDGQGEGQRPLQLHYIPQREAP